MKKSLKLIISIAICQIAGAIGSFFTIKSVDTWYQTLNKPSFTPPSWVFGPAWITLYTLMGIALFLVWQERENKDTKSALTTFGVQLLINSLWSILFFGMQNPLLGLVDIVILWTLIILTIIEFIKISKPAGILLIPYLLWVTFASVLNLEIFLLN